MCYAKHTHTHILSDPTLTHPSFPLLVWFSLQERIFLTLSNYIFTAIFVTEMTVKVGDGSGILSQRGIFSDRE